jgi:hypothetical protein
MAQDATKRRTAALVARVFVIFACLLYVASIPGATVRSLVLDVTAAPLPESVRDRDGALDVFVKSDAGGAPIPGARARAYAWLSGRAHFAAEATTDATGRARLDRLPRAEHWIVVEADGHARASRMVVIVEGARRLDLSLGPERELQVEVKAESGAPVAGAELEVRAADPFPVGAKTDAEGRARVGRLGDGPFSVLVRAAGFEEVRRRGVAGDRPLVVTLSRQGTVVAKVTGPDGEPVDGARVQIASGPRGSRCRTQRARCGSEGSRRASTRCARSRAPSPRPPRSPSAWRRVKSERSACASRRESSSRSRS